MYLCKKCLTPYNISEIDFKKRSERIIDDELYDLRWETSECPKEDCTGATVQVDELILPTIIELNRKGWKTKYCCSGHPFNQYVETYISFESMPPNLPENFKEESNGGLYYKTHKFNSSSRPNNLKRCKQLYEINLNLYEWALGLPINDK